MPNVTDRLPIDIWHALGPRFESYWRKILHYYVQIWIYNDGTRVAKPLLRENNAQDDFSRGHCFSYKNAWPARKS